MRRSLILEQLPLIIFSQQQENLSLFLMVKHTMVTNLENIDLSFNIYNFIFY